MRVERWVAGAFVMALTISLSPPARAQEDCSRAVIFTMPGVTWGDVQRAMPPHLLDVISDGATASLSVRTNSSRTSYASGFATIGAGTRVEGGNTTGGQVRENGAGLTPDVMAAGIDELRAIAAEDGYDAIPGALGEALEGI